MDKIEKRVWETQYECTGCARWYYSESDADSCCGHGVYELSVCSRCWYHIDHCNCDDISDIKEGV